MGERTAQRGWLRMPATAGALRAQLLRRGGMTRIAVVQPALALGEVERNLARVEDLKRQVASQAKLELELKREYTAVFSLFRYCILTQDATYLCNTLDLKVVPQASYPFFHLQMEDVWVWDKNRPTRMIPRAKVYTSGDVTIEELRGEGDEPTLTAEDLAERIGEPFRPEEE